MTDYLDSLPVSLTGAQLKEVLEAGAAALTSMQGAGGSAPPVGVWQQMYHDIDSILGGSGLLSGWISDQEYWYSQASFVNGNDENVPAGYFVRDVTAIGMNVSGPSDVNVQKASDAVGEQIYEDILHLDSIPAFWSQLNGDIYSAFKGEDTLGVYNYPNNYPTLPMGAWGGTFYYWNSPYSPTETPNSPTPPPTALSQYILGDSTANETFITDYSQAIANTVIHFQSLNLTPSQILLSTLSALNGTLKIFDSGLEGVIDIAALVTNTIADYIAAGGSSPTALQNALLSLANSQVGLYLGSGSTMIAAGGDSNVLVGGQGIGTAGNDTLTAGGNLDTFLVNLPATGTVTETINDSVGLGQIIVANGGQFDTLGGSAADPLTVVAGQQNTWQDAGGTEYTYSPTNDQLVINGGYLASGNEVIVDNFNVAVAAGTNPNSGTAGGFAGIFLPQAITLTAAATIGTDPPDPTFVADTSQSFTLSVDAPSATAQTVTVALAGAPASSFEALVGTTLVSLSAGGTFTVTLPAGATNVEFGLLNTASVAQTANLTLTASIPNPMGPAGSIIDSSPLAVNYVGAPQSTAPVASSLYGFNGSPGYFADYPADSALLLSQDAAQQGDSLTSGTPTGNAFVWLNNPNTTVVASGNNDTILGEYGWPILGYNEWQSSPGGANTIVATGQQDIIENDSGQIYGSGPVGIYASGLESLTTAITASQTGVGTGQQGDLIVGISESPTTVVGSNGNDFITNASGNDVIVAGAGNDTIFGGVLSVWDYRYWGELGYDGDDAPPAALLENFGWSASVANGPLVFLGMDVAGDTPGVDVDPLYPSPYVAPPAGYEGNTDMYGNVVGGGNETIFGGTGASLILLSNGNNYVDMGPGASTVEGGMGDNTVIGGSGAQLIVGGGGSDYLTGGSGNATIVGRGGDNTIIGGSGTVQLYAGAYGADYATYETGDNYVFGGSGRGSIYGSGGADTLVGGTGNYSIFGGAGSELIVGGSGTDLLTGGTGNDTIEAGGSGNDSLYGEGSSASTTILYGGDGSDLINGGSGANVIYAGDGGAAGAPTTVLASQSDATATTTVYGGLGVDELYGGPGSAVIYAGDGGTSGAPTTVESSSGNATLYGGLGTDLIEGGSGSNQLYAGDGTATVIAGVGASTLYGGAGTDFLEDVASGEASIVGGTGNDSILAIGNDTVVAGTGNDSIQVNSGNITLQVGAGGGNDTVLATAGPVNLDFTAGTLSTDFVATPVLDTSGNADFVLSGDGDSLTIVGGLSGGVSGASFSDTGALTAQQLLQSDSGGSQTIAGTNGDLEFNVDNGAVIGADLGEDTISSWGNNAYITGGSYYGSQIYAGGSGSEITGSFASDTVTAAGNNDSVWADDGGYADRIKLTGNTEIAFGGNSNDTLTASGLNDTLVAGTGNTDFVVNNASAVVQGPLLAGADTLQASVNYTLPTNVNILVLTGSNNLQATGNLAADELIAGGGTDSLIAGTGVATMIGGAGSDTFVVNSTSDVVQDTATGAANTVQSSVNDTLVANVNTLVLTGTANLVGTGNAGSDTLVSNSGVDTLIGGPGSDVFVVNNAADVLLNLTSNDTVQSSVTSTLPTGGNMLVLTGTTALSVTANTANDTLVSNVGVDTLVGSTGNETFVVNNASDVIQDTSATASNTIASSVSYTLPTDVTSLVLTGSASLSATGNAQSDTLTANAGADTLTAGSGVATLVGGPGNDTFVVNNVADVISNSSTNSNDTLQSSVNYTLPANVNTVVMTGAAGLTASANSGNDTLVSNTGIDTLMGGTGNDTFVINNTSDVIQETASATNSVVEAFVSFTLPTNVNTLLLAGSASLTATANTGNDSLVGNAGSDTLDGGTGTDTLVAGTGADTMIAGTGTTTFIVNNAADVVQLGGSHGADTVDASVSYTRPTNVAALVLTGSASLVASGTSGAGMLQGNSGADTLQAGSGTETLIAGSGVDTLIGGTGNDVFVVDNSSDVVQDTSSGTGSALQTSVSYTLPTNVNAATLTGGANIIGTANAAADFLTAGDGNDTLIAGAGSDTLVGGAGGTTFVINNSSDVVQNPDAMASDTMESSVSYSAPIGVNTLLLTGTGNLTATANAGVDTLSSNGGVDTLIAGAGADTFVIYNAADVIESASSTTANAVVSAVSFTLVANVNALTLTGSANLSGTANTGNDTLVPNAGADTLVGGAGNDTFIVNNVADVVTDTSTSATNTLDSSVNFVLPTNVNALILTGNANLTASGNSQSDVLTANAGNDTLSAGSGVATLIGGSANDTFIVNSVSDVVQDSTTGTASAVQSSVNYSLPTNITLLTLTGTGNLVGTANSGADTLVSNSGVDTLVGGTGADVFIVNNASDVLQNVTATDTIQSSVSLGVPTGGVRLVLIGTANLTATANTGSDTLTSNSGADTLVGGAGNNTFYVNNSSDVVSDTSATATNAILSSVSYTLPTNVNLLTLTGSSSIAATGNGQSDKLTANTGNDTLVAGSGVATLVGGTGNELFIVDSTSDVVENSYAATADTIQSSVNYTLPTDTSVLQLTGSANLSAGGGLVTSPTELIGNAGNDTLKAGTYDADTLIAGSGVDTLIGNGSADIFVINNAADVIEQTGSSGSIDASISYTLPTFCTALVLTGTTNLLGMGSSSGGNITGNSGNDTLIAGTGSGSLIGGTGNTTFIVNSSTQRVSAPTGTNDTLQSSANVTLASNVDTLVLTGTANLTAYGNADLTNVITANSGNDSIYGEAQATTITGGSGSDYLAGGTGSNVIYTGNGGTTAAPSTAHGSGYTTIYGGTGVNDLYGGSGADLLVGGTGTVDIVSGSGVDTLEGGGSGQTLLDSVSGQALLLAGSGSETLGGTGSDTFVAGSGNDYLYGTGDTGLNYEFNSGFGTDTIEGGVGTNENLIFGSGIEASSMTITVLQDSSSGYPALQFSEGTSSVVVDNALSPGVISSISFADTGSESLQQLLEAQAPAIQTAAFGSIDGPGNFIVGAGNAQSITGGTGSDSIWAYGNNDTLAAFLDWPYTEVQSQAIVAYGNNDVITGGNSPDSITAFGNNELINDVADDTVVASGSNDTIVAGSPIPLYFSGDETFFISQASTVIEGTAGIGSDTINSSASYTLPSYISTLALEGSNSLTGTSNAMGGTLEAFGNYDTLVGGSGADTLSAQGLYDSLAGGSGANTFVISSRTDTLSAGANPALDSIDSYISYTLPSSINTLTVEGSYIVGTGNSGNDVISFGSDSSNDTLVGGSGNDTLTAPFAENAVLIGGTGTDTFVVSSPYASVDEPTLGTNSVLESSVSFTLPTNINTLLLTGSANLVGTANSANDSLDASAGLGNDTLVAGSGADTLVAGAGADVLQGGLGGGDTFVFNTGFGNEVVSGLAPNDTIAFGSGITQASLSFSAIAGPAGSLPSLVIVGDGGSVTVQGGLIPTDLSGISFGGGAPVSMLSLVLPTGRQTLAGSSGNLILSSVTADSLNGGSGDDTIVGWGNNDTLTAGTGGSAIYGGGNNDLVTGGASTDTLVALGNTDTLVGGSGSETLIVNASAVVQVQAGVGQDTVLSAVSYTVPTNVTILTMTGSAALTATGNAGTDVITANAGADTLIAGSGIDTLIGSAAGNQLFALNNSSDVVIDSAGGANDSIQSSASYTLVANISNLTLTGTGNIAGSGNTIADLISANSGADTLSAGTGIATLVGGAGNDLFVVNSANDVVAVSYTDGIDTINSSVSYTASPYVADLVLSGTAAVIGTGNSFANVISANSGADTLVAGTGLATLVGGSGNDTFLVNNLSDVVQDTSSSAVNIISSSVSYVLPTNVNQLSLSGTAALSGTGNSANDTLVANSGADTLVSGAGATDSLVGGTGSDLFVVNYASDIVTVGASHGIDTIQSSVNYTAAANVANLTLIGTGNLVGTGNTLADIITANSGSDTLTAGTGLGTLVGGSGNDLFVINNASDVVSVGGSLGTDTIDSSVSYTLSANVADLKFTGASALTGTGNSLANVLSANTGADTLIAGSGLATLVGGSGNDTFIVNNSSDVIQDTSTAATNVVSSSVSYVLPTDVNRLILTGAAALSGTANSGNDTIIANRGADTLVSGTGTGVDSLVGGAGDDLFVVNYSGDIVSVGVTHGNDTIESSVSYTASANVVALTLTGTSNLTGTGNSLSNVLTANSGNDSLVAGAGIATLVGGSGNDTFTINSASDVVQDTSATSTNVIKSSVTYTLPTDVSQLILTGASALVGTGNNMNDTLTANTGADTLIAGAASTVDSLVGGTGANLFVVNNAADTVTVGSSHGVDTIQSSVSYTAAANVADLTLIGTSAISGTGNTLSGTITANSGSDTLTAGSGADVLVGSSTGNDIFVVNSASDTVSVGTSGLSDTIESSVSYTASANVVALTLTGTSNLTGTGNSLSNVLTANSGNDSLVAGTGVATLVGGSGNDTFTINNASDVVQDTSATSTNVIKSSATYTLPTDVSQLILTGASALVGAGNNMNDTLTANTGADTLIAGAASTVDSLVGGSGANLFVVNNTSDIVTVGSSHGVDTIQSSVSYTASTNVADLTLTGTSALSGTGNSLAGILTANSGADTLTAGSGADTLIGSSTGTDLFVVNSASDIVSQGTSGLGDTIESSASYTLPTNVAYLTLTGTSALTATGNSATDLLVGNSGADTLIGGTGIAALEGGRTAGSDQIKASSNQAALIAGAAASTLTGGAYKDFYAAGLVSDTITTGATANVVSVNKGDGATTLAPTTSATNVLSLGAGIDTENLEFTKSGNNLVLTDGVAGDSITFTNWYAGSSDQDYVTLQVIELASANYNSGGGDPLRDKPIEAFNLTTLVSEYNTAGSPANWALSNGMPSAALTTSASADYGGDLAYYFGLNGNVTGVDLSDVPSVLTNSSYGTATQAINSFGSISGGGGLQLLVKPAGATPPIASPTVNDKITSSEAGSSISTPPSMPISTAPIGVVPADPNLKLPVPKISVPIASIEGTPPAPISHTRPDLPSGRLPEPRLPEIPRLIVPHFGLEDVGLLATREVGGSLSALSPKAVPSAPLRSYVDPITVAWATMHGRLDQVTEQRLGGSESPDLDESAHALEMLTSMPVGRLKSTIGDPNLHIRPELRRAL